ncbi:MAG TPA: heavy metal-binding domain-containing protein [Saprospiraceae bacterium]|nr:heavy metal-binding domain-containing protein [Saprospiraceae bacterium]
MKPIFKLLILPAIFLAAGTIACKNAKQDNTTEETSATAGDQGGDDHVHTFACPMHPDIQGHEGEKCSKCGMPLEHMDHVPVAGNYMMEIKPSSEMIKAGVSVDLSLTPRNKDNMSLPVPLDVEHEKKIHLIAVSEDLSWFDHIHPEYQADGSYLVKETFPGGGKYLLYADYKPTGSTHQLEKTEIQVEGKAKAPANFKETRMAATSGAYTVTLKPDGGRFLSNQEIHFDGQFSKGGKTFDVSGLQSYLGAKGHMVGIQTSSKTYVHLHPEVENGILHFHATFPEAGMYRAWLQFIADDQLHTVDFTIKVEQGEPGKAGEATEPATHNH